MKHEPAGTSMALRCGCCGGIGLPGGRCSTFDCLNEAPPGPSGDPAHSPDDQGEPSRKLLARDLSARSAHRSRTRRRARSWSATSRCCPRGRPAGAGSVGRQPKDLRWSSTGVARPRSPSCPCARPAPGHLRCSSPGRSTDMGIQRPTLLLRTTTDYPRNLVASAKLQLRPGL